MTDQEFDIIDELYFVTPFAELRGNVDLPDSELRHTLQQLLDKGWLRVYTDRDQEIGRAQVDLQRHMPSYLYLASKEGLMAHNLGE